MLDLQAYNSENMNSKYKSELSVTYASINLERRNTMQ